MTNVIVIGAGGVGTVAALSLKTNGKANVSLVVRSDYPTVVNDGYSIDSIDYGKLSNWTPDHMFKDLNHAFERFPDKFYDYVLITTKNIPDGPKHSRLAEIVRPILERQSEMSKDKRTNILLIQNGIDIEKQLWEQYDTQKYNYTVLSGIEIVGSHKVGPGIIHQMAHEKLTVGPFDMNDAVAIEAAKNFVPLYLNEGKNECVYDGNTRLGRWKKLLYNAVFNTTTALLQIDTSRSIDFGKDGKSTLNEIYIPAMYELQKLAKADGVEIQQSDMDFMLSITHTVLFRPSMCVDVDKNQLTELEVILGNPVKLAEKYNVQIPVLRMLYYLLVVLQNKIKESHGLIKYDEQKLKIVQQLTD